jgi:hypothetical protein
MAYYHLLEFNPVGKEIAPTMSGDERR